MKKQLFLLAFCLLSVGACFGQPRHYGDTIYGRNPHYFYQWWPDEWFPLDTIVMYPDTSYVIRNYDPVNQTFDIDTIADSVPHLIYHSAYHEIRMNEGFVSHTPTELVQLRHTDSALCIVGLAGAVHKSTNRDPYKEDCDTLTGNYPSEEYLLLYKELPDTFVCLRRECWNMETPGYVLEIPASVRGNICCERGRYTDWTLMREYYFDTPIVVTGDFYVGGTFYNNVYGETCYSYYESLVTGCMTDSCPTKYFPGKHRNIGFDNDTWVNYGGRNGVGNHFMLVFPIIGSMCPEVIGCRVSRSTFDSIFLEWNTDRHHASWELQYYPVGTSPDSGETIVCHSPMYILTELDSAITYVVRVRAICTYDSAYRSDWQSILVHKGMTVGVNDVTTTADDGILLRPNPADRQVTVSATMPIKHVEVYDLAGRLVETRQPSGTALQLDLKSYPTGTYLVKVTTTNGTTTKKLVVK